MASCHRYMNWSSVSDVHECLSACSACNLRIAAGLGWFSRGIVMLLCYKWYYNLDRYSTFSSLRQFGIF